MATESAHMRPTANGKRWERGPTSWRTAELGGISRFVAMSRACLVCLSRPGRPGCPAVAPTPDAATDVESAAEGTAASHGFPPSSAAALRSASLSKGDEASDCSLPSPVEACGRPSAERLAS